MTPHALSEEDFPSIATDGPAPIVVKYSLADKFIQIGSLVYRGDFALAYDAISHDGSLSILDTDGRTCNKHCSSFTIQMLLFAHEQEMMRQSRERMQGRSNFKKLFPLNQGFLISLAADRARKRARQRFELHGLTRPTIFSIYAHPEHVLSRLLEEGEVLLERIQKGRSSSSSGQIMRLITEPDLPHEEVVSATTLHNRWWRIIREGDEILDGFKVVTVTSKDKSLRPLSIDSSA